MSSVYNVSFPLAVSKIFFFISVFQECSYMHFGSLFPYFYAGGLLNLLDLWFYSYQLGKLFVIMYSSVFYPLLFSIGNSYLYILGYIGIPRLEDSAYGWKIRITAQRSWIKYTF